MRTSSGPQLLVLRVIGREVVMAVTNGRLDGSTELAEVFGTWERIFQGQAEWLARESRRPAAEAGAGQDRRGVVAIRAILAVMEYGTQGHSHRAIAWAGVGGRDPPARWGGRLS